MRAKQSPSPGAIAWLTIIAVTVTACMSEPIVEMSLGVPSSVAQDDTSCITAVEIRAIGRQFAQDATDYSRACIELPRVASTYAELQDLVHGRFTLDIPHSGLGWVTVRGWAGVRACERTDETFAEYRSDVTSNLAFYGKSGYIGQDEIDIRAVPNVRCPTSTLKVRVVDMLALVASGSSSGCSSAMSFSDRTGQSGAGTIIPKLFGNGVEFFGNAAWAEGTNNLVQLDAMFQRADPAAASSCLALMAATAGQTYSTSCVVGGPSVCAGAGELEAPTIRNSVVYQVDQTVKGRFPSVVWGSVWNNATPKTLVAGVRVTIDPEHGKVVYIDPPDAAGLVRPRADQTATGPSGLFIVYTNQVVAAKIEAAGKTRTVQLGAPDYAAGGAMIVLP